MILAAIVIAFLLDQIRSTGHDQAAARLLRRWMDAATGYVDVGARQQAWLAWAVAVVPPVLVAGLAGWLCTRAAGWFGRLAWDVATLYFTLGFRQFSHHYTTIRDALAAGDEAKARALLAQWRGEQAGQPESTRTWIESAGSAREAIARGVIEHAVLSAHRCVFGVLFWFSLFGLIGFAPAGAVLYRCADCAVRYWRHKTGQSAPAFSPALLATAQTAWTLIDWLPSRLTALIFALVGNFEDAIAAWRQRADSAATAADTADSAEAAVQGNDAIVLAAAAGALGIRLSNTAQAPSAPNATQRAEDSPTDPTAPADTPPPASSDNGADPAAPSPQPGTGPGDIATDLHIPPPDWVPAAPSDNDSDDASAADATVASAAPASEPDLRHFTQVAALLWRSVALWLLLLVLLTLAHVLG